MQLINITKAVLEKTFLIFPQYCLGDALLRLSRNQLLTDVMKRFGLDGYQKPFTADMLLWHVSVMAVEGLIFFAALLFLEARLFVITKYVTVNFGIHSTCLLILISIYTSLSMNS